MLQNAEEKTKEGKTGINEIFTKCQTKGRGRNSKD
jgi:biotin-(acetyl-CoA carboxylase) ligase